MHFDTARAPCAAECAGLGLPHRTNGLSENGL